MLLEIPTCSVFSDIFMDDDFEAIGLRSGISVRKVSSVHAEVLLLLGSFWYFHFGNAVVVPLWSCSAQHRTEGRNPLLCRLTWAFLLILNLVWT